MSAAAAGVPSGTAPTLANMSLRVNAFLAFLTLAVVALTVGLVLLLQEQRKQEERLSRLDRCVSILERNQGTPEDQPIIGCPIDN